MIKAVIFDLFGVLIGDGFDSTYKLAGGDPQKDREFIKQSLDLTSRGQITRAEFRGRIVKKLGVDMDYWEKTIVRAETQNLPLLEYIEKLHAKYKTAILSNANTGVVEQKIEPEKLKKLFDAVVVSADVGYIKPEPQIYLYTADLLKVNPEECIFIDDREGYIAAACKLGMKGILYKGYDGFITDIEKILSQK